mgnify:CR=1 FL=1
MIYLNKRLMNKRIWIKVTPIASYVLSEGTTSTELSDVIYLCDIETKCSRYKEYIAEKVLVDDYDQEDNVMKNWRK